MIWDPTEAAFHQHLGTVTAALTRSLGARNLDLVESAVQEACMKALAAWPVDGLPDHPDAWLLRVARNHALDDVRRARTFERKEDEIERFLTADTEDRGPAPPVLLKSEIADDLLRMMFVSCHPANSIESQIALTLRVLCGMEVHEIARALLADEGAVEKRLVRARQRLREENVAFDLPPPAAVGERFEAVLKVVYLLFNEGYSATRGVEQVREDLCAEAIRLGRFLVEQPLTERPEAHALLALMLLQASRLAARTSSDGQLLTLAEQDRSKWDRASIARGLIHLGASAEGDELTQYHLEAAIAACHATAATFEATDWIAIAGHYGALARTHPTPVIRLNRAVALGFARGPDVGLSELLRLADEPTLQDYLPLHAALGHFYTETDRETDARAAYERALVVGGTEPEVALVRSKLAALPRSGPV